MSKYDLCVCTKDVYIYQGLARRLCYRIENFSPFHGFGGFNLVPQPRTIKPCLYLLNHRASSTHPLSNTVSYHCLANAMSTQV